MTTSANAEGRGGRRLGRLFAGLPLLGNGAVGGVEMVMLAQTATKPVRAIGGFFAMSLDTFVLMFKPPFAWKEYIVQCWFVARVSTLPALLMTIP